MNVSCLFYFFQDRDGNYFSLEKQEKYCRRAGREAKDWAFTNTECRIDKKIAFKWNTLFQAFQSKYFQLLLQDYPSTDLSKGIYKNISRSGLHRATTKTPVLPCLDVIEWMAQRIDHESITILNFEGKHVASYQDLELS
jgi:hypothetical protein